MRSPFLPLLILLTYQSFGQPSQFEVSSVKANHSRGRTTRLIEPGKFTYLNITLGQFIELAYGVKHYQLSGPDWVIRLDSDDRYDIIAKAATPVPTEQLLMMLRPLLAERFHLTVHRESRVVPVYLLVPDKKGPKLSPGDNGATTNYPDGAGGMVYQNYSMAAFANLLSMMATIGRPVLDHTGLNGVYTFKANLHGLSAGLSPGEQKQALSDAAMIRNEDDPIFGNLQEQLGLKLEGQKAPVQMLVIDHVEKIPAEN